MDYRINIPEADGSYVTLADILPPVGRQIKLLVIGKTPMPDSVASGHYFQSPRGKQVFEILQKYDLMHINTLFEDDSLLNSGIGATHVVKKPHQGGDEPTDAEYYEGKERIDRIIKDYRPEAIVFLQEDALRGVMKRCGEMPTKVGFNPDIDCFGPTKVFLFPQVKTSKDEAEKAMLALKDYVG